MKQGKKTEKDNSERWLLTYSDLMNLLLILFIILYCSSQINPQKAVQVSQSMHEGFGGYTEGTGSGGSGTGTGTGGSDTGAGTDSSDNSSGSIDTYWDQETLDYEQFYESIEKLLEDNGMQDDVHVTLDDRGVVISFKDNVLFASGDASLGSSAYSLIGKIGDMLKGLKYSFILVEGHTDSDPIHTVKYVDNMDLSTQRAGNVWRALIDSGLSPDSMACIGYGENKPLAPNDTSENKAKNRCVIITILRADIDAAQYITATASGDGSKIDSSSD